MKIGLQIPDFTTPRGPERLGKELARVARTADDAGFEMIAVMDHFFQIRAVGPAENDMLEGYTTLGYIAAHTREPTPGPASPPRPREPNCANGVAIAHPKAHSGTLSHVPECAFGPVRQRAQKRVWVRVQGRRGG
jgi:hypothetical protein